MKEIPIAKKYVPAKTNASFHTENISLFYKANPIALEQWTEEVHHENTAFMKTKIYERHVVRLSMNGKKVL
jgi:hypothetical protein